MRILTNYQTNLYSPKKSELQSRPSFGIKPMTLSEADILNMPATIQARIRAEQAKIGNEITEKMPKTAADLFAELEKDFAKMQKKLNLLRETLAESGQLSSDKFVKQTVQKDTGNNEPKIQLQKILEYKSKKYQVFNQVLDSNDCSSEEVREILNNLKSIKKEYRYNLIEKMIDVSAKNKDKETFKDLFRYVHSAYLNTENKNVPDEVLMPSLKKFFEASSKMDGEDIQSSIGRRFYNLANRNNWGADTEIIKEVNNLAIDFAAKTNDIYDMTYIYEMLDFNKQYAKRVEFSPESMYKALDNYLDLNSKLPKRDQRGGWQLGNEIRNLMEYLPKEYQDKINAKLKT